MYTGTDWRKVHLLLGPRPFPTRRAAVEQPALEPRRILKPDAAVALEPRRFLDLFLLRRVMEPDSLRIGNMNFIRPIEFAGPGFWR